MGFESVYQSPKKSISDYIQHVNGVLTNNLLHASFAHYNLAHHSDVLPVILQFEEEIKMFDTDKLPGIIEAGEIEGENLVPVIKKLLDQEVL
jgi:NTE family protein